VALQQVHHKLLLVLGSGGGLLRCCVSCGCLLLSNGRLLHVGIRIHDEVYREKEKG
jgi:hypothetical protein